jgi:hypothetical protein
MVTPRFVYKPKEVAPPAGSEPAPSKASVGPDKAGPKAASGEADQGDEAPVAPPDQSGYAK